VAQEKPIGNRVFAFVEHYVYDFKCMTNTDTYIKPTDVHSPKRYWSLIHVLFDGGADLPLREDRPETSCHSLAMGRWDGNPVLAIRWNGGPENPLGNPQSRGLPTWFILPEQHWKRIYEAYNFSDEKIDFIRNFLELKRVYFVNRCPNPECRDYQGRVVHQYRMNELGGILEKAERGELKFYHIICDGFWKPDPEEKADLIAVMKPAWEHYCNRGALKQ
jgi:hypothetical protein